MPPKVQIAKEMIIDAGFSILRYEWAEPLNVRRIAAKIKCSTQPIMYQFSNVEELKSEIYAAADRSHDGYIMNVDFTEGDPMLSIGLQYIRFAVVWILVSDILLIC